MITSFIIHYLGDPKNRREDVSFQIIWRLFFHAFCRTGSDFWLAHCASTVLCVDISATALKGALKYSSGGSFPDCDRNPALLWLARKRLAGKLLFGPLIGCQTIRHG
jgi:hypothetical protein